jgi:hypothetical protein
MQFLVFISENMIIIHLPQQFKSFDTFQRFSSVFTKVPAVRYLALTLASISETLVLKSFSAKKRVLVEAKIFGFKLFMILAIVEAVYQSAIYVRRMVY